MLDPKVAELVSRELSKNTIVIFDEAHNIDNVCIESLSIDIDKSTLESSQRSLVKLTERVDEYCMSGNALLLLYYVESKREM